MKKITDRKKKEDIKKAIRPQSGHCKFEPLHSLDLSKIKDFDDLARAMSMTSFGGRQLGEAVDVLYKMVTDPDCFVVGTFSGAMTPAKMGLLICDMIDLGMVNAIVSTGALMTHGLVEGYGMTHFKYQPGLMPDEQLRKKGYNRIYDTLEVEKNLDDLGDIFVELLSHTPPDEILCSYKICKILGKHLHETSSHRGIMKSAYEKNVPIYIPAFSDSEIGLDFALFNRFRVIERKPQLQFNPFLDLEHFTDIIVKQKTLGIFTIGGGVPRNWAQQVSPYIDLTTWRIKYNSDPRHYFQKDGSSHGKPYKYGLRICPEPVHWGGLSGCTYAEGVSWAKFVPEDKGGKTAEVMADATIAWPIILKATIERIKKDRKKK